MASSPAVFRLTLPESGSGADRWQGSGGWQTSWTRGAPRGRLRHAFCRLRQCNGRQLREQHEKHCQKCRDVQILAHGGNLKNRALSSPPIGSDIRNSTQFRPLKHRSRCRAGDGSIPWDAATPFEPRQCRGGHFSRLGLMASDAADCASSVAASRRRGPRSGAGKQAGGQQQRGNWQRVHCRVQPVRAERFEGLLARILSSPSSVTPSAAAAS